MKAFKSLIFLVFLLILINMTLLIRAESVSSEGISIATQDLEQEFTYDSMKSIYEISSNTLEKGYSTTLGEKDAFRLKIQERVYYLIVWNISENELMMAFPGQRQLIFSPGAKIAVDVDENSKLDIDLILNNIEDKKANFHIKKYEKEIDLSEDYYELFDVTLKLEDKVIPSSRYLDVFILFDNFGEGASEIEIIYSIINETGGEMYKGIDTKIVETQDSINKNFGFLDLPDGKYKVVADIFYGENQTAGSEESFEVAPEPFFSVLGLPLIFILVVLCLLVFMIFAKRLSKNKKDSQK